jgi:colanic acid biosynthesis glycosyl transferase WcaI
MNKRVLLLAGNFSPELTGIGKYNGEMIDWLSEKGYECTVITTFPYYPQWKVQEHYGKEAFWFKKEIINSTNPIKVIRCPHYVPKNPSGFKRLISEITILLSTSFALLPFLFRNKYDYIISVAPPFELGILGVAYKKIKRSKFLYHIQDLQIDAAQELNMVKSSLFIKMLFAFEKYIIKNADVVSTISKGMMNKVEKKCNREIVFFPNWVDVEAYYPIKNKVEIKGEYGFNPSDKIILYSGAIGEKQGLEAIVYAAKSFEKFTDVKFVICGTGPYKESLIALKNKLGLINTFFLPLQASNKFNAFLNMADLHLILQKANASDLVLPSKLTTVLAIGGVAIVSANPNTSLYDIMASTDMGFVIAPENLESLENAILKAINNDNTEKERKARSYAVKYLSRKSILSRYAEDVLDFKKVTTILKSKEIFTSSS